MTTVDFILIDYHCADGLVYIMFDTCNGYRLLRYYPQRHD